MQWEGYLTPFFVPFKNFAKKNGYDVYFHVVKPAIIDHENTFERIRQGGVDLATPSFYFFQTREGRIFNLLSPIKSEKIKNFRNIIKKLHGNYSVQGSKNYGVPFTYGTYGLAYNSSLVSEPKSWKILWDKNSKNFYSIYSEAFQNIFMINLTYGRKTSDAFNYDKIDKKLIEKKLTELYQNAKYVWSGYSNNLETINSLKYLTTWGYDILEANKKGSKWKMANPMEGSYVWLDSLVLTKEASKDNDKEKIFYMFCDYILSAEVQIQMMRTIGSIPVNIYAKNLATIEEIKTYHIGDEFYIQDEKIFNNLDKRTELGYKNMWDKIKDSVGKK